MDVETAMFIVPWTVFSIFAAYYAMKFTAHRRYVREEAAEKAERERKRQEKKAAQGISLDAVPPSTQAPPKV